MHGLISVFRNTQSLPFRYSSVRETCSKLFVGGLCYDTNETVLKDVFGNYGEIIEVRVVCEHVSGKSKGYGFVKFISEDAARIAQTAMHGQMVDGRNIRVEYAHKE